MFRLVNDGHYRTVECIHAGRAEFGDGTMVDFPLGWGTDITSTPWFLHSLIPQLGPHAPAAILHDRLLDLGVPRKIARRWMRRQLQQLPLVNPWRKFGMIAGVWCFDTFVIPWRERKVKSQ